MAENPYTKHSLGRLKAIERELVQYTRNPNTPGYRRRVALQDLRQVRQAIKTK